MIRCSTSMAVKTNVTWHSSRKYCVHKWMAELKYGWLATPYPRNKTLDTEGSDECSCGPWFLRWQGEPWGGTHSSFLGIA